MQNILTSDILSFLTKEYRNFIKKRPITENSSNPNYKYRVIDNKVFKLLYGFSRKNRLSNPNSDLDKIIKQVKKNTILNHYYQLILLVIMLELIIQ